jgi:hypothetical protein
MNKSTSFREEKNLFLLILLIVCILIAFFLMGKAMWGFIR